MKLTSAITGLLGCLATLSALPAVAGDPVGQPLTGEILTGWQQRDGTRIAAIKLTLAPGWKTYWRAPGDAGIPPTFDWSASSNLRSVAITWPTPKVFDQGGMQSIGYATEVVLPITLAAHTPGSPVTLSAQIDLGVCSDICVPQQLSLRAVLSGSGADPTPAIAAALAARPYSAAEAGVTSATCTLRPAEGGLVIETKLTLPTTGGAETVVIEPGQPNVWASPTITARNGNTLTARGTLSVTGDGALAIDRSALRFTVLGQHNAVDIKGCTPG